MLEIECLWECNDGLGETPIWVAEESSIYWADHVGPAISLTDSRRPSLRRLNITTGERKTWDMPEQIGSFGFRGVVARIAHALILRRSVPFRML